MFQYGTNYKRILNPLSASFIAAKVSAFGTSSKAALLETGESETILTPLISICYEGGLDANGHPADTRTLAQKVTMEELLHSLCVDYPDAEILGHRDLPNVRKDCPCFDVRDWLEDIDFHI